MEFKYDLFISYSGFDNQPLSNEKGWVTSFSYFLDTALERLLKRRPRIILSHDLESSAFLKTPAIEVLSKTTAFISIISPSYVKSKNFQEAEDFVSSSSYSGGLKIGDLYRMFKVVKAPIDEKTESDIFKNFLSYDLYQTDYSTQQPVEITDFFESDTELEFWSVVVDLAYDIANLIFASQLDLKNEPFSGKTIFLSDLAGASSKYKSLIKRDLQKHGYKVVPDRLLQKESKNYQSEVQDYLKKADLSIHLIGDDIVSDNSNQVILEAQDNFVTNFNTQSSVSNANNTLERELTKLIWMSPDIVPASEKQKNQIEQLKKEIESVNGAEVIQAPLEVFKSIIHEKVKREKKSVSTNINNSMKSVYLIYSLNDHNKVDAISKLVSSLGYQVLVPTFEGNILDIVQIHRQHLIDCDGVIIYYGEKSTEQWLRSKLIDIQKALGFGKTKSLSAAALVVDSENFKSDQLIDRYNLIKINGKEIISPSLFMPFTNKIK